MKRTITLALAACLLACAFTGCSGYASVNPDTAPGYDSRYSYETTTAYRYSGNVSTTDGGRVNGTNRTLNGATAGSAAGTTAGRTTTGRSTTGTTSRNTDAMGAGTRG